MNATAPATVAQLSPGSLVEVRGETWLVNVVERAGVGDYPATVQVTGTSELVRGVDAVFLSDLDDIRLVRAEDTKLVTDSSAMYSHGRLYLEAVARRTPIGSADPALRSTGRTLVDDLAYQRVPVHKALTSLRPRILIADAVGLGKTIEVATLLNELSLRGAAGRVLAVVPQAILEQVQHELWCRTGFPLVRLDTPGIARMRSKIPAGRNPFAFFKRVIVSIDTIKQPGRYRPFLRDVSWDVVWIDECHSLINRTSQNSELARVLADRTDAMILTSATPHNGSAESFAELISLLDPTAIADPTSYTAESIERLFVRRHRHSVDVASEVGDRWAERPEPDVVPVTPSPTEEAIFAELTRTWIRPGPGGSPATDRLFPWTLFKAALSSTAALTATISRRLQRESLSDKERDALNRLAALADAADAEGIDTKFAAVLAELKSLGVKPGRSGQRAVIFSERVDTLEWLAARFQAAGWTEDQIVVFHNGLDEQRRQEAVKEFGLGDSKVRLFITGDMASEGVNLHRECHVLFHWDLPWSLIRIQQRNGRIDRYGQTEPPIIKAFVTVPADSELSGDARIIAKLLAKEHAAHRNLGDAAAVMGEWDADAEEGAVFDELASRPTAADRAQAVDDLVPMVADDWDWSGNTLNESLAAGAATTAAASAVPTKAPNRVYDTTIGFVVDALRADDRHHTYGWRQEGNLHTFKPPPDLTRRFDVLPNELVKGLGLYDEVKVTGDATLANKELVEAAQRRLADRELNPSGRAAAAWPAIGYLTDDHPVVSWAVDRAMTLFGRGEAPIIAGNVTDPVALVAATWANQQGEPMVSRWAGIELGPGDVPTLVCSPDETFDWLTIDAGIAAGVPNTGEPADIERLQAAIPNVVAAARAQLEADMVAVTEDIVDELEATKARLGTWAADVRSRAEQQAPVEKKRLLSKAASTEQSIASLIANRTPAAAPHVRVVAVIVPGTAQ